MSSFLRHCVFVFVFVCVTAAVSAFAADPLPAPSGPVILTVTGEIGVTNADGAARFDRDMLEALPQASFVSYTDWTVGPQRFEGVLLKDLIARIEGCGAEIFARALNNYGAPIPWSDLQEFPVLLALRQNGEEMRIRDKGPIWIIYPDPRPSLAHVGPHNDKMVWQLETLELR
ncbi:molybdopterin-dependent oxidoreductase [Rhodospirillaceae bacterium SYSU D60014]|uniref:molybdopterin-dependent oxidoreductase n=1 Tax=Virgifigura deserti TaxID=2268457 RepID=UPI0013C46A36